MRFGKSRFIVFGQPENCFVSATYFFGGFINFRKIDHLRKNISTKRHQIDCFQEVSLVTGSGRDFFRFPTMKIERTGMIDYTIWRIGISVFQNRFFFSVFAINSFLILSISPKSTDFEKLRQQNVTKSIPYCACSRVAGPGRAGSGRVGSGRVVYRFSAINS